jgi:VanZ family protein
VWAGVIFALSAQPGNRLPSGYSWQGHFAVYAILGALLALALDGPPRTRVILLAVVLASLYGVSDEFHQSFVPLRTPDWRDWAVDTVGAAVGASVALWAASARRAARSDSSSSRQ